MILNFYFCFPRISFYFSLIPDKAGEEAPHRAHHGMRVLRVSFSPLTTKILTDNFQMVFHLLSLSKNILLKVIKCVELKVHGRVQSDRAKHSIAQHCEVRNQDGC